MGLVILRRLGALFAIVGVVVVAGATPAFAHAALVGTDPVAGQAVDRPPDEVVLTFTEPVDTSLGSVRLYDSNGSLVDTGGVSSDQGATVVTLATPGLELGSYVVTFRVISEDGHPIQGAFTFSAGSHAQDVSGLAERLLASDDGSVVVGVADAVLRFALYVFVILLVGVPGFAWLCWRERMGVGVVGRLTWIGWWGVLVVTCLAFLVRGPYLAGLPLGEALDGDVLSELVDARYGRLAILRVVVLLAAVPVLRRLGRPRTPAFDAVGAVLGLGVVATISAAGHAGSGDLVALALGADVVHLAAAAVWIGGLCVLSLAALRSRTVGGMETVVMRFSKVVPAAVALIVVSGAFQTWRLVKPLDSITDTDYGRILLVKLGLVAAILVAAAVSRSVVRGWATRAATDPDDRVGALRTLRRSVAVEVGFAVAVLATTSLLVVATSPVDELSEPSQQIVRGERMDFDVLVTPATPGRNDIHIQALDPQGILADVIDMQVWVSEPSRDISLIEAPLRRLGPGHYFSPGFDFPFAGEWTVDIRGFVSDTDVVDASATVDIR